MNRGITAGVLALLDALRLPMMAVTFEFVALNLLITNHPKSITLGTKTYRGAQVGADTFAIVGKGLGENLTFEAPSAVIEIASVNAWVQTHFFNDDFRGDQCIVTLLYVSGGSFVSTGWATTYTCDAEEIDANKVNIRLGSLDSVTGTDLPRRATQSEGCQWEFEKSDAYGGCTFRWDQSVHPQSLRTCDRTFDGPNGCVAHFSDVIHPRTGLLVPRPKPYGAYLGSIDHRLVRGRG